MYTLCKMMSNGHANGVVTNWFFRQVPKIKLKNFMFAGGGSVGCQTLYHLAKRGVTNAVLLEKDSLTAGTTWHTAGLVWRLRPSDVEIQLLSVKLRPLKYY